MAAPPYSPPSASPCNTLTSRSSAGAKRPTEEYVGNRPVNVAPTPMTIILKRNANFRPTRSPSLPNTAPPNGLTAAPDTNAAKAAKSERAGVELGKKTRDRTTTRDPYTKRSYHSITLPRVDAMVTKGSLVVAEEPSIPCTICNALHNGF